MRPRRFAFVTIGYPPFLGGSQVYVRMLAEGLVKDGHAVTVFTTDAAEVERIWDPSKAALGPVAEEEQNGVRVRRFPVRHLPLAPLVHYVIQRAKVGLAGLPGIPEGVMWGLARYAPWVPGLRAALDQQDPPPDVVHGFAIAFESLLRAAGDYANSVGAAHMVTPFLHAGPPEDPVVRRAYAMPHQVALMRGAAAVVALTEVERDLLMGRGVSPERIHVVPAGIQALPCAGGNAAAIPGPPSVLFLGALTFEKGAVHLVKAVARLRREGLDLRLTLAGNVTGEFERFYRTLSHSDRGVVAVPGMVTEEQKLALLRASAVVALPSRVDSFGLVLLEAWRQGKPVVGARAGGIPAVVDDGVNGLLVPFGDVPALAAALQRLVEKPQEAGEMGAAGRVKLGARYTWERIYPQLVDVYEQVLA